MSGPDRACPGRTGRPGSLGVAGRGSLILPGVAGRGAQPGSVTHRDPANPADSGSDCTSHGIDYPLLMVWLRPIATFKFQLLPVQPPDSDCIQVL